MFPSQACQFFFLKSQKCLICVCWMSHTHQQKFYSIIQREDSPVAMENPYCTKWSPTEASVLNKLNPEWYQLSLFKSLLWCEVLWMYNNKMYDNPWKEELNFCWYTGMRHLHAWLIHRSNLRYWYKYENKIYI